ncbi:MAG: thiolase family protein [Oscillospiraceae bacterium]
MDTTELRNKYAIAGVGYAAQGKVSGRTSLSLYLEACANAIKDSGIPKEEIDGVLMYRWFSPLAGEVYHNANYIPERLGLRPSAIGQEFYCYRTWLANAIGLLETGVCKNVLITYADTAKSGKRQWAEELDGTTPTDEYAAFGDITTLAKYAMVARRAMYEFGTGPDVWKEIVIAQRRWANLNPLAASYSKTVTAEEYLNQPMLCDPFRIFDTTPVTDGGRAIIISAADNVKSIGKNPLVTIRGYGQANVPDAGYRLFAGDPKSAACEASRKAYAMAGLGPKDIGCAQIYDCFTYTVEATLADYGFFDRKKSAEFLTAENLGPGGKFPLNTSGGMLSEGYFMGMTPVVEGVMQMMGRCGARQLGVLPNTVMPEFTICSDNGAYLQSHETLILERSD